MNSFYTFLTQIPTTLLLLRKVFLTEECVFSVRMRFLSEDVLSQ
jgi:hypothetical protein